MKNKMIRFIVEIAIASALFLVLDFLAGLYSEPLFVNGGNIGIAMVCIFIISYRWGLKGGLLIGLVVGLVQTFTAKSAAQDFFSQFFQVALDYWAAYLVLGFSGLLYKKIKTAESKSSKNYYIIISVLLAVLLRAACAITAGIVFWGSYVPEGIIGLFGESSANPALFAAILWSFIYNLGYLIPSAIICSIVLCLISNKAPILLEAQ